nr:MAG TPA: hypothetical protein [Caudoviricetes sp.]
MAQIPNKIYSDAAKTTEATPQQVYDAFMAGKVVLSFGDVSASGAKQSTVTSCAVFGAPGAVVGIKVYYDNNDSFASLSVGDTSGGN